MNEANSEAFNSGPARLYNAVFIAAVLLLKVAWFVFELELLGENVLSCICVYM